MSKKSISVLIKTMIIFLGITGIICCIMMPRILEYILPGYSAVTHRYWLILLIFSSLPCFMSLFPAWGIARNIGNGKAFTNINAKLMKWIGCFMAADALVLFVSNIFMHLRGFSFFAIFIAFFLIIAIFSAIAVCAFALSSLLKNATELQVQSDLTI